MMGHYLSEIEVEDEAFYALPSNHCEDTRFGFRWGPVEVERAVSDPTHGVTLVLKTARWELEVRVTPSGLFRPGVPKRRK